MNRLRFIHSAVVERWPKATDLAICRAVHQETTCKAYLTCENKGFYKDLQWKLKFLPKYSNYSIDVSSIKLAVGIFHQCHKRK